MVKGLNDVLLHASTEKHKTKTLELDNNHNLKVSDAEILNIKNNQTNGTHQVKVMALSTDGTQEQIGTDNNNNVKCNVINTVLISPANNANAEMTPTTSFNCKVANTVNNKLEDLSSSLDFNNSNVSRAIAVGLRARQDPSNNNTGVMLRATNNSLNTVQENDFGSVVILKNNENINGYYQFISPALRRGQKVTVMVKSETGSSQWNLNIEQSIDDSQYIDTSGNLNELASASDMKLIEFTMIAPKFRITFQNIDVASAFTIKYII
tara:strand:- start:4504 stop:5301 length:798 start_codon:yes stop_codon:yes gene_type:complete